jgi:hypothetical protein
MLDVTSSVCKRGTSVAECPAEWIYCWYNRRTVGPWLHQDHDRQVLRTARGRSTGGASDALFMCLQRALLCKEMPPLGDCVVLV